MKNVLSISFFFILLLKTNYVFANCDFNTSNYIRELKSANYIKLITITTSKTKKFDKNFARIITSDGSNIPPYLKKKKFKAIIKVKYDFGNCSYEVKLRQHGDWKNHVLLNNGRPLRSLDISMNDGNIINAVKYKLLIPETRFNKHEILGSLILKKLGFIVPETFQVQTNINGDKYLMLFQEKAVKELLERNNKREGPIFEGDENLLWSYKEYDNFELENVSLARLVNKNWFNKGENYQKITLNAFQRLQNAYLHYIKYYFNSYKVLKPNFDHNSLFKDYYLILEAMNGTHALRPHNRKFYFNSFTNYFEPIYYDGDLQLNKEIKIEVNYLYSEKDKKKIEKFISKLKSNEFLQALKIEFNNRIIKPDDDFFYECINQIVKNLEKIHSLIQNKKAIYSINQISKNDREDYYENHKKKKLNQFFIEKFDKKNNEYELILKSTNSEKIFFKQISSEKLGDILSKNLHEKKRTIFLPRNYSQFKLNSKISKIKKLKFYQGEILYSKDLNLEILPDDKEINISQSNHNDWILFSNIDLKKWNINFKGVKLKDRKKNFDRMNYYGMTGCVNFYNVKFNNNNIFSSNGLCEDSINLINSYGLINSIYIKNASADGLDADFSNIRINKLNIEFAANDCVDFSKGKYEIFNIKLYGCKDKGVSVGEESILKLKKGRVEKSYIGIASKDSSIANIENIIFKNVDTCFLSYNKKQEFYGSLLQIQNSNCENYVKSSYFDNNSSIKIN